MRILNRCSQATLRVSLDENRFWWTEYVHQYSLEDENALRWTEALNQSSLEVKGPCLEIWKVVKFWHIDTWQSEWILVHCCVHEFGSLWRRGLLPGFLTTRTQNIQHQCPNKMVCTQILGIFLAKLLCNMQLPQH